MNGWFKEDLEEMCGDDVIDQLAFVSGCHQHKLCNSNPSGWIISDEVLRVFAELIVRKCAGLVQGVPTDTMGYRTADQKIKEHFGVEVK